MKTRTHAGIRSPLGLALAVSMVALLLSTSAIAANIPCIPDDFSSASAPGGTLLVAPSGGGETLAAVGSIVAVLVRDCNGVPIANFPRQDVWLDDSGFGRISICRNGSIADQNTDANGKTTISTAIAGGGHTQGPLLVLLSGLAMYASPLDIQVVSPDLDGDLAVTLADLGQFAVDFGSWVYQFRSDLTHDGRVDLADVGAFAQHFGVSCP